MPRYKKTKSYTLYSLHLVPILILVGAFAISTFTSYGVMSSDTVGSILGKKDKTNPGKSLGNSSSSADKANSNSNASKGKDDEETGNKNSQKSNAGGGDKVNRPDTIPNNVNNPGKKANEEDMASKGKSEIKKVIKNEVLGNNPDAVVLLESVEEDLEEIEEAEDDVEEIIDEVEGQPKWKTILFGSDYKNLGQLRSQLVRTTNTIRKMNKTMTKNVGEESQLMLQEQIATMEQEKTRLTDIITENEDQFSILGWVRKLITGYTDLDEDSLDTTDEEASESTESTPSN